MDWLLVHVEKWHDTYEVIGAVFTAIAVIVALAVALYENNARQRAERHARELELVAQHERRRAEHRRVIEQRAARSERRRAQALRVIAWHEVRPLKSPGGLWLTHVVMLNGSTAPIFDVSVHAWADGNPDPLPITERTVLVPDVEVVAVQPEHEHGTLRVFCYFRDLAGVFWRRDEDGTLLELDANGDPHRGDDAAGTGGGTPSPR